MRFWRAVRINPKTIAFAAGLCMSFVPLAGASAIGITATPNTSTSDPCGFSNNIIASGFSTASGFISTVKGNNSGNGHRDLQAIYAAYGLEPADYDKFVTSAEPGQALSDGRVVVDGRTVATGGKTIGRTAACQGSNFFTQKINGVNYYGNTNQGAFAPGVASIPVMVFFNAQGAMQFAVMEPCGNPEGGQPVTPTESCNLLHETAVKEQANTYQFTTDASAGNGAKIDHVVYDFGDGSQPVTKASPTAPVTHTYSANKPGTFTAKVTVYVDLPGKQTLAVTSAHCQVTVTVAFLFECLQLAGSIPADSTKMTRTFVATAGFGPGVTFTSADFSFGDGHSKSGVKPDANGKTATFTYTYAKPGTYDAKAVLHFMAGGKSVTAPQPCAAKVTPKTPPTPECKPGVPVGSPACSPCSTDASLPSDSPQCVAPPPSLPNTGAGDTIAIFAGVFVIGFLIYRQLLFRRHKAAFLAAQNGTSLLPLGDPLSEDSPLAGTPLASKRRSFRRKRPF